MKKNLKLGLKGAMCALLLSFGLNAKVDVKAKNAEKNNQAKDNKVDAKNKIQKKKNCSKDNARVQREKVKEAIASAQAKRSPSADGVKRNGNNEGYAYAYNKNSQNVHADDVVHFSHKGPHSEIKAPCEGESDFVIYCSGTYLFEYEVRGLPTKHSPPAPLIFELRKICNGNESSIPGSRYASDNSDNTLKDEDTELVYGFTIAHINASNPVTIQLHNLTNNAKSMVHLLKNPRGGDHVVNASLKIILLEKDEA